MPYGYLLNVAEIKAGDEIINLGIVEKAEHWTEAQLHSFTITKGKCISQWLYWFKNDIQLWVIKAKSN